nr:hypothetical protein [Tanacetum cinerariifolium]
MTPSLLLMSRFFQNNFPSVVSKATSVPARSRNSLASISAGRSIPAVSRNRPASIHAGRHIPVDENVANFLTKAFDGPRFHYLFLVAAVWLFTVVLFRSCCWNKVTILEFSSEDLSRILK